MSTIQEKTIKLQKEKEKERNKEEIKKHRLNWKIRFKMEINTYLLIIALCQWLKCSKDIEWKIGLKTQTRV